MHLLEETREIVREVEHETGRPVVVEPDESLTTDGTWRYEGDRHLVRYHPRWEPYLDHTVAHEAGHVFRLWAEDPEVLYLPASTPETRKKALRDLEPDYLELVWRGIPSEALRDTFDFVYEGAIQQLTNVPIDIRIEEWIRRRYAALRDVQARALRQDVEERYASLHPLIRKTNPRRIYKANQALNATSLVGNKGYRRYLNHRQGLPDRRGQGRARRAVRRHVGVSHQHRSGRRRGGSEVQAALDGRGDLPVAQVAAHDASDLAQDRRG